MQALVVEDDPSLRKYVKEALLRDGFDVDTAENGQKGLDAARAKTYDIILLDLRMPGIDGYTVCKTLRDEEYEGEIFMVTGLSDESDRLKGFNHGADRYFLKPFSLIDLLTQIHVALKRDHKSSSTLSVGPLQLDAKKGVVQYNGKSIRLRKKECEILSYLMCHAGEAVSQQRIARHVWGFEMSLNFNAIESQIKNLRAKLDSSSHEGIIETMRGYGYMLKA